MVYAVSAADHDAVIVGMNHVLPIKRLSVVLLSLLAISCKSSSDFDETGGIKIVRSSCPAVAVPAFTGDVTTFAPGGNKDASAIDVIATITNVRASCAPSGDKINATASFDVLGRRSNASGARDVVLPFFATVTRAGTQIQSKQIGRVALHFADGQLRAQTNSSASASISAADATLPTAIEQKLNRKRKAGDTDAAVDPMTDPTIRTAVSNASFELLVGFQLTDDQLAYNATR